MVIQIAQCLKRHQEVQIEILLIKCDVLTTVAQHLRIPQKPFSSSEQMMTATVLTLQRM